MYGSTIAMPLQPFPGQSGWPYEDEDEDGGSGKKLDEADDGDVEGNKKALDQLDAGKTEREFNCVDCRRRTWMA